MKWWERRVYFDAAAGISGNPSSSHEEGRRALCALEDARTRIARLLEVHRDDVIFTGGATEANALAILGLSKPGAHLLYLPSAHASVVENMKLAEERGALIEPLPIRDARVDTNALAKVIRPETVLVSMDAVCGETGVIWNTREVAQALSAGTRVPRSFGHGPQSQRHASSRALLHIDASQAPLTEKLTRTHFGADLLTLDASKVCRVRGIGTLVAHRTIPLVPLYRGGGQERGIRPGSEAPELAQAFAAGLEGAARRRESFRASAKRARADLVARITAIISDMCVNEGTKNVPHILNLSFPGRDTDYLVALLDEAGFAVSTRSACETDSEEGSRAVMALTGSQERARATLRISWGPEYSTGELARLARALAETVAFIDKGSDR